MLNVEEFQNLINNMRDSLDETTRASVSDPLINILANYTNAINEIESLQKQNENLVAENGELLQANGKLFAKLGVEVTGVEQTNTKIEGIPEEIKETINPDDFLNEKGEFI